MSEAATGPPVEVPRNRRESRPTAHATVAPTPRAVPDLPPGGADPRVTDDPGGRRLRGAANRRPASGQNRRRRGSRGGRGRSRSTGQGAQPANPTIRPSRRPSPPGPRPRRCLRAADAGGRRSLPTVVADGGGTAAVSGGPEEYPAAALRGLGPRTPQDRRHPTGTAPRRPNRHPLPATTGGGPRSRRADARAVPRRGRRRARPTHQERPNPPPEAHPRPPPCPVTRHPDGPARNEGRRGGQRAPWQGGRPLHDLRAGAPGNHPDRTARGAHPGRALHLPGLRRRHPDRREHLPGPGPERAPRYGGGVHRHRNAQECGALPRRRPLRHRGRRVRWFAGPAPDRAAAPPGSDHPLSGDQEPDRGQGGPAHPGGVDSRPIRGAGSQQHRLRHLQAARGRASARGCDGSSTRSARRGMG